MGTEGDSQTDYPALLEGYVTITPVKHDLTHQQALETLGRHGLELPPD